MKERKCNCGALIWCYIDGYLIEPRRPKRLRPSAQVKSVLWRGLTSPKVKNTPFRIKGLVLPETRVDTRYPPKGY